MRQAPADPHGQIRWVYRRVLGRDPDTAAAEALRALYDAHAARYRDQRNEAERVVTIGNAPMAADLDVSQLAAFTSVCRVLLNLHETITRY
jgi:hypothetical protein